jgi:membrane-bound lytic murein transglycosylase A
MYFFLIKRYIIFFFIIPCLLLIAGCFKKPEPVVISPGLYRLSNQQLPLFEDDLDYRQLISGIQQSLIYLKRIPSHRVFAFGNDTYDTSHMIRSLEYFLDYIQTRPVSQQLNDFIQKNYRVYCSTVRKQSKKMMFTGYYEPLLRGNLIPSKGYCYPVFALPDDLLKIDLSLFSEKWNGKKIVGRLLNGTVIPYYTRKQITNSYLSRGKMRPLLWVDNQIDLFFLQIQGSGKVKLERGKILNLHYAGTNGHPYRSIGSLLIKQEKIAKEEMSMQKIKAYLTHHPDEIQDIFNFNPSYVFFQIETEGPLGNLNVPLTPARSIATDQHIFPPAVLCYIQTQKPVVDKHGDIRKWIDFGRFVLNQDTGGAIRGAGRADLFCGHGAYAEITAGHLRHDGDLYTLILKP